MAIVHSALITEDRSGWLSTRTRSGPESFFPDPSGENYYWVQVHLQRARSPGHQ